MFLQQNEVSKHCVYQCRMVWNGHHLSIICLSFTRIAITKIDVDIRSNKKIKKKFLDSEKKKVLDGFFFNKVWEKFL